MHRLNINWNFGNWLIPIIIVILVILAFEVWMFVDVAINEKISNKAKAWWIIGMFLIHPIVAIFYFFTDHRKRMTSK
ncbi:MAG: hypothetical protein M1554_03430 [Patescibacteria group bacterium]|jgi:hypothetical protein|nr:hypothetical protein [Patescibacteria group bacterium]